MSVADFVAGLMCHNKQNFAEFNSEQCWRVTQKRVTPYVPTEDYPSEQKIVLDEQNVLMRFMRLRLGNKMGQKRVPENKNGVVNGDADGTKRSRLEDEHQDFGDI